MKSKFYFRVRRNQVILVDIPYTIFSQMQLSPLNTEINPIRHLLALVGARHIVHPIRHLLALVGARHIVHVSRVRVNVILQPTPRAPKCLLDFMFSD